jgi:hypothetical protein
MKSSYQRYLEELDLRERAIAVVLLVFIVAIVVIGFAKLVTQTGSDCVIQLSDGSVEKAESCTWWSKSNTISCAGSKRYSLFAVKSWECK